MDFQTPDSLRTPILFNGTSAIGGTSDQFLPIVSQVDSRATILVEYVTNIDKSISILHRTRIFGRVQIQIYTLIGSKVGKY